MVVQAIKFSFPGGLHISRGADELDKSATRYGSDALKSAIYAVGINYYPQWLQQPDAFFSGLTLSSAYPWAGNQYFLPKPPDMVFAFSGTITDERLAAKKAKKVEYVSLELFNQWVVSPKQEFTPATGSGSDARFASLQQVAPFMVTNLQQRVTVSRVEGEDATPFYFEKLQFAPGSGLYSLFRFSSNEMQQQVMHVLHILGDLGIGTDRTVGNGQFTITPPEGIELREGTNGFKMPLGLYLPTQEEVNGIDLDASAWNLVKRGGYIAAAENPELRTLRKNNIYFFTEGSRFKTTHTLGGQVANLRPEWNSGHLHPVWRCGMPLFLTL